MTGRIVGVVLAAGISERMGRPKQLLPFRGSTLVGTVVAAAEASGLDEVVVVVGASAPEVVAALEPERAVVVHNRRYEEGNLSSLRVGLEAAGECDGVVLVLADMPDVTPELIDHLVARWREDDGTAAVCRYADGLGHPFLLSRAAVRDIAGLSGHKPLWGYLQGLDAGDRLEVPVPGPAPRDIDTPDDYAALLAAEEA